jgi:7,8-dihydropterin-6-yl-methyl-4-(beta-D-ribofuranosyl)aminobenzene 5'-phosphate synthase
LFQDVVGGINPKYIIMFGKVAGQKISRKTGAIFDEPAVLILEYAHNTRDGITMKLSILTDNRVEEKGLLAEHGLSVWIETDTLHLLFDTGQTDVYRHNAAQMGIDLQKADAVILSHGHYDHCGGLAYWPCLPKTPVYAGAGALDKKKYKTSRLIDIGVPPLPNASDIEFVMNAKDLPIAPGVALHADIPYTMPFEGTPTGFFTGSQGNISPDLMRDEQMLVITRGNTIDIFLGCSHPGIINCLHYAQSLYPGKRIRTVLAGMHLKDAKTDRIDEVIRHLNMMNVEQIIPMHCTGPQAICRMTQALGDRCRPLCAGQTLSI